MAYNSNQSDNKEHSPSRLNSIFSFFLLLALALSLAGNSFSQGYEIRVKVKNLRDTSLILGHRFATNLLPDDTVRLDKQGMGVFKGREKLKGGMYFLFFPSRNIMDFLLDEDQFFTLEIDTSDLIGLTKATGSVDNEVFFHYRKFLSEKSDIQRSLRAKMQNTPDTAERNRIRKQLENVDKEVMNEVNRIISSYPGTFVSTFVKATKDIDVPDFPRDSKGNVLDSAFKYKYFRNHYFDHLDYTDSRLLKTPIYDDKFKFYFEKVIPQIPDTLIKELDPIIEKARKDPEVFRYVLVTLFNHYAQSQIMGHDGVFIHIAEKYYIPEATWTDKEFIKKLKDQVSKRKPTLIGQVAPDFQMVNIPMEHFLMAKEDTAIAADVYAGNFFNLHQVKAKFTILMFWESDCGHCQKSMPVLFEIYKRLSSKGVQIVALHMLGGAEGKKKWVKFVNDHEFYGWINAWNPYDYSYKEKYDIKSTPILYLLDEQKKIIAKLIPPETAEEIIQALLKEEEMKTGN